MNKSQKRYDLLFLYLHVFRDHKSIKYVQDVVKKSLEHYRLELEDGGINCFARWDSGCAYFFNNGRIVSYEKPRMFLDIERPCGIYDMNERKTFTINTPFLHDKILYTMPWWRKVLNKVTGPISAWLRKRE